MAKDLTQGRIMPMLIKFTIPLILGNIFQLTYNAVDSIIVGRFVGKEALAAVGICNPITTLIILFLNGLCMGASILMGNYFGGKKMDTLSRQISTTMISGMIFSLALTLIAIVFTRPILMLVQVDRSIMTLTTQYLRIIMLGLIFTFLYNFFSSTLRALGDSATPLYFLIISAVLNVFGDLFFVVILKTGSNGCAVATVVSEALCCVFCMIYIKFKVPILCLGKKWLVFDRSLLKKTISYGWASAMQQATVQLGKIGIQAIINTMGVSVSAAFAVVNRIDDYAYTPEQNIAHGMTAMMAQNKGAGRDDRVIKGFKAGIILEIIYGIFIFFVCFVFAGPLMKKLGYPTIFCNELIVAEDGEITGFKMRCEKSKYTTVKALQSIGYDTIASGDSHNDLGMIQASKAGFLFKSTDAIKAEYPDIPAYETYDELLAAIKKAIEA